MIRLDFSVTGISNLCEMRVLTPDQLEQALLQEEANIARSRARQMQLIHLADAMQLPNADGCRSMREWVAGRLDISREAAFSPRRPPGLADLPDLAQQMADGRVTFDRAAASPISSEHQDAWLLGPRQGL